MNDYSTKLPAIRPIIRRKDLGNCQKDGYGRRWEASAL